MAAILTRTKEGVLAVFEVQGEPICAIYEGNKPLTCITDDSKKERRARLEQYLDFMEQSGTEQKFEIRFYEVANKNGKVNSNDPFFGSLPFTVTTSEKAAGFLALKQGAAAAPQNNVTMDLMFKVFEEKIERNNERWERRLEDKEREIEELQQQLADGPEYDRKDGITGIIGTIGEVGERYVWLQQPINDLVSTIKDLFNGAKTKFSALTETPVRMAGITEQPKEGDKNARLAWSQKTLIQTYYDKYGVKLNEHGAPLPGSEKPMQDAEERYVADMCKLAEIAATKPNTFETAIKSLREM